MIESIRTFNGVERANGRAVVSENRAYRCVYCGLIKLAINELVNHPCNPKKK